MRIETPPVIAAFVATRDRRARARLLHDGARALLANPTMVDGIADAATAGDSDELEAAAELLSRALDEARMAAENDAPEGPALMEAVAAALSARDAATPFSPAVRMRLAQIYARASLAPPPVALLTPEIMGGHDPGSHDAGDAPDIGAALDELIREMGDDPLQLHAALGELFAGLPPDVGAVLVAATIARPGDVEAHLGLYWLLDRQPQLRLSAATALLQRAEAHALPPDIGTVLPTIRKWLPDEPARDALDATIRRLMRNDAARAGSRAPIVQRAAASLPDGAGAQSLIAAVQVGKRRGVAMIMLKQGHGVKDAFVIPCASAAEQKRMLGHVLGELETVDVGPGTIAEMLSVGLGEGALLDKPPAPGLVDMVAFFNADALLPGPSDTAAILAAIGAEDALGELSSEPVAGLIDASDAWSERFEQTDAWFEDTGPLRAAITRARTDRGRETAVWKHLETRRDWWARQFAVSAATLRSQIKPEPELWLSFAAVAQALIHKQPLKKIPIMAHIMALTLDAFDARESDPAAAATAGAPAEPGPGMDREIGHLLQHAGMSAAYLEGYLTALAISPLAPKPQAWLGPLLAGIEFPGEGALERLLDLIMMHANRISDEAAQPDTVAGWIAALDAAGLCEWTEGFTDLVKATRSAWPAKSTAADDKRVLKDVAAVAKGAEATVLRKVLPAWVARRHASRQ